MATVSSVRSEAHKSGSTHVNFFCQKCGQPLKLDHSFNTLTSTQLSEFILNSAGSDSNTEKIPKTLETKVDADGVIRCTVPSVRLMSLAESGNDPFLLLGASDPSPMENLSHKLKVTSYLFDILSEQADIDHPLCEECTDSLLDQLDQQLKITEDECKEYKEYAEKLETEVAEVAEDDTLDEELTRLKAEEDLLRLQLDAIENEHLEVTFELKKEKEQERRLEEEEARYMQEYNEYKRQLLEYEDAQRSVDNQLRYEKSQLEKLKKINVFNATFHIWHSGHFGTINNFRLGRLPSMPVEWNEINAAWGQTVLLLNSLAKKMGITFQRYRLVPYGNHSFIESLADKSKELPLYGSGGIRFFWNTKFDQAMVAFLDCLQQFKEEVEKGDAAFRLPYQMEKGKIEDASSGISYSVKIQFNSEEQWTKALKFMLTNLKWALAWVSSQFANK